MSGQKKMAENMNLCTELCECIPSVRLYMYSMSSVRVASHVSPRKLSLLFPSATVLVLNYMLACGIML